MDKTFLSQIAVSDVDGTLVKGSLVLGHAVRLHDEGHLNLGSLPALWSNDQKNETAIYKLAEAYREAIKGMTVSELRADEYISELVTDSTNFYSTLDRLQVMRDNGSRVVLISGSPSFLVERFGAHYGFDAVGSQYLIDDKDCFTGDCVGMFSGDAKREYLKSLNLNDYAEIFAFGDTMSDAPLFESASYSVLVEPNAETNRLLGATVHEIVHH